MAAGAAPHGRPQLPMRVVSGELENTGIPGPGGKEKQRTGCVAGDSQVVSIKGDWGKAVLDSGV